MFNDKVFIRTIAGLGVDSATAYLDTLVNKNKSLLFGVNNRSRNVGLTNQLFKTHYINKQSDRDGIGVDNMNDADPQKVREHLYSTYLSADRPLKIVPIHFQDLDYDYVFEEFRKVDISANEDFLAKLFVAFFHKFALVLHAPFEKNVSGEKETVEFYSKEQADNPVQTKIAAMYEKDPKAKVPLLATYFAEHGKQEDDYEYFFKNYYTRFLRCVDLSRRFKSDTVIDANDYLFEESPKALDQLVEYYSDAFTKDEYDAVRRYNIVKVLGNHQILEDYGYIERVDSLSHSKRIEWLMKVCISKYEEYKESIGYK
jgi:hypothetical protein